MSAILGNVLPIIFLLILGYVLRRKKVVNDKSMQGMKFFVANISLSCVLFNLFINMELDAAYIPIFAASSVYFIITLALGFLFDKIPLFKNKYTPFLASGCSLALIGLGMFSILYGQENLAAFSVMGLAHESFVWIIYYSALRIKIGGKKFSLKEIAKIFTSPLVLSIILGMICNVLNINVIFADNFVWDGLYSSVQMLAQTATPIILVVVGYGITINKKYLKPSITLLSARYIITLVCGTVLMLFINYFLNPTPIVNVTFISMLLMPPLSSAPILVGVLGDEEGQKIVSNAVALGTLIGILMVIVYSLYILGTGII